MSNVNLMAMVQPDPRQVYEQTYDKGDIIRPDIDGLFTYFSSQALVSKETDNRQLPIGDLLVSPGHLAPYSCVVIWLAANEAGTQAILAKNNAKLVVPSRPRLINGAA